MLNLFFLCGKKVLQCTECFQIFDGKCQKFEVFLGAGWLNVQEKPILSTTAKRIPLCVGFFLFMWRLPSRCTSFAGLAGIREACPKCGTGDMLRRFSVRVDVCKCIKNNITIYSRSRNVTYCFIYYCPYLCIVVHTTICHLFATWDLFLECAIKAFE